MTTPENKHLNEIVVLGSGTSTGIPMVGCKCEVCTSSNPNNTRLRTSIFLKTKRNMRILIDTGPDLRTQILNNDIDDLDFAIITHDHADHTHGIDDLRPFCFGPPNKEIPIYTHKECADVLREKFPYIFKRDEVFTKDRPVIGGGIPRLSLNTVEFEKTELHGEIFEFLKLAHGYTHSLGFVHEKFAYIIDCHELDDELVHNLNKRELDLLIIDCTTLQKDHKTHLNKDKCFKYIERIKPKKAFLIHMNHQLEHEALKSEAAKVFDFPVEPLIDSQRLYY